MFWGSYNDCTMYMLTGIFFLPKKQNVFFLTLGADFEVNLWALN